jgi:hypothetical protein
MLCADLIDVWWMDDSGHARQAVANLEDISSSGVCLQLDAPVANGVLMHICHDSVEFEGRVRYCVFRDTGYFIGVQFEEGFTWDAQQFQPKHLLDPRTLLDLEPKLEPKPVRFQPPPSGKVQ